MKILLLKTFYRTKTGAIVLKKPTSPRLYVSYNGRNTYECVRHKETRRKSHWDQS